MSKSRGKGVGLGHGGNSPNLPAIRKVEQPPHYIDQSLQPGTTTYRMGKVTILISPPFPEANIGWHMSIACRDRYPTWDEIAKARYELIRNDIDMVMFLPRPEDYINIHNNCFQLHELPPFSVD